MSPSPWLVIVLFGVAITGYAWMMPKTTSREKETEFASEAAYSQLLEDLESENRELLDAVAKFKREQDDTVEKLGRRIVDMEHQMRKWTEQTQPAMLPSDSKPPILESPSFPTNEIYVPPTSIETIHSSSSSQTEAVIETATSAVAVAAVETKEIEIPPTTIRGRYPELLEMHDRGRSVEQIAKATGMNKGEVQLILQLALREEQQHA